MSATYIRRHWLAFAALAVSLASIPLPAAAQSSDPLWTRPLDELMQVEVISVGKKEERVFDSAAAVYVVTKNEIRRSGLTTVPDLLRLVPGVTVARIDASKWAVSVRGFTNRYATKLLVMIDGRSLYSRVFSGVFWDTLGVPVDEIERIEVIRGPGASLWGANAVNGVINIVTQTASATKETRISAAAGAGEEWLAGVAHQRSTPLGDVRVFAQATEYEGTEFDTWRQAIGGARLRRGAAGGPSFTLDVNAGHSDAGQRSVIFRSFEAPSVVTEDVSAVTSSASTVARWTWPVQHGEQWQVTAVHDWMSRYEPGIFDYAHQIADLSVQHRSGAHGRHDLVWGGGFRYRHDAATAHGLTLTVADGTLGDTLLSGFIQDQIRVARGLEVTVGTKVERTSVTGWNLQPTLRAWWSPDGTTALWGAVSRALRIPSRADMSIRFIGGVDTNARPLPLLFGYEGNPAVTNEELAAYEAGMRTTIGDRMALDVSGYYNRYDGLLVQGPGPRQVVLNGPLPPHVWIASTVSNGLNAQTAGIESVVSVALAPQWHVTGTFEIFRLTGWESDVPGATASAVDGGTPHFQWTLRSNYSRGAYDADLNVIAAPALSAVPGTRGPDVPRVPAYTRVDARISRRLGHGLEVALVGQNLFQSHHLEAGSVILVSIAPVPRTASVRTTWRFGGRP